MSDRLDIQLDGFDATMSRAVQHLTIDDVDDLAEDYLNQRSRIAALEAQVAAADRLDAMAAIAQDRLDLAGHDDIRDHLSAARANYHAANAAARAIAGETP